MYAKRKPMAKPLEVYDVREIVHPDGTVDTIYHHERDTRPGKASGEYTIDRRLPRNWSGTHAPLPAIQSLPALMPTLAHPQGYSSLPVAPAPITPVSITPITPAIRQKLAYPQG